MVKIHQLGLVRGQQSHKERWVFPSEDESFLPHKRPSIGKKIQIPWPWYTVTSEITRVTQNCAETKTAVESQLDHCNHVIVNVRVIKC